MHLGGPGPLDPTPPRRPHDDNAWRHGSGGPRIPNISVTHIIGGLILIAVMVSAASFLLVRSATPGFEAVVLHPDDGATLEPGRILVRFRTSQTTNWQVQYSLPGNPEGWETLAQGGGEALPGLGGNGTRFLDAHETGTYVLRLTGNNNQGEAIVDTVEFTVK